MKAFALRLYYPLTRGQTTRTPKCSSADILCNAIQTINSDGMQPLRKLARVYGEGGLRGIARAVKGKRTTPSPVAPLPRVANDSFFDWLGYANAGMLAPGNIDAFDFAMARLPTPDPMIEIGSFCGLSTNVLTYLKQKHRAPNKLISCDRWIFESDDGPMLGKSEISHADYREFVRDTFIRNVRMFSRADLPYTVELFSDEFFAAWETNKLAADVHGRTIQLGGPISLCFIDGNHTYDFARRDFLNTDRWLVRGGFVIFDDSSEGSIGEARRVAHEAINTSRYRVVAETPNYFLEKL